MNRSLSLATRRRHFFQWWREGLLVSLPGSLRNVITPKLAVLTVAVTEDRISFRYESAALRKSAEEYSCLTQDKDSDRAACLAWLGRRVTAVTITQLRLPEEKILHKSLTLPAAAAENLRQALAFEMERITPFSASQVYFDYTVKKETRNDEQLVIDLYITPRESVDHVLAVLKSFQLSTQRVQCANVTASGQRLKLLPVVRPEDGKKTEYHPYVRLSVMTLLLFLAVLYVPIYKQHRVLEALYPELEKHRALAVQAKNLEIQRDALLIRSQFLANQRAERQFVVEILNDLTHLLPDNTWLSRLSMTDRDLQIQGESDTSSALIEIMEKSGHFTNTHFISPVLRNAATQKDQFNIATQVTRSKP